MDRLRLAHPGFRTDAARPVREARDEAALDAQRTLAVDADEGSGTGALDRLVADRPILECRHCGLDLTDALVNLVGQFVRFGILRIEGVVLGLESASRLALFLVGEANSLAGQPAQAGGVAAGDIGRDRDPFPTFGALGPDQEREVQRTGDPTTRIAAPADPASQLRE